MIASLAGKTALVTGAGRGIGRAAAVELAAAGMAVALVARSEDQRAETGQQVKQLGGTAIVVPADFQLAVAWPDEDQSIPPARSRSLVG